MIHAARIVVGLVQANHLEKKKIKVGTKKEKGKKNNTSATILVSFLEPWPGYTVVKSKQCRKR